MNIKPRYSNMFTILEYAIKNKKTCVQSCLLLNFKRTYFKNCKRDFLENIDSIDKDVRLKFDTLLGQYADTRKEMVYKPFQPVQPIQQPVVPQPIVTAISETSNILIKEEVINEDDYDTILSKSEREYAEFDGLNKEVAIELSINDKATIIRNTDGKIIAYKYFIEHFKVPYEGIVTRVQMENIYALYPHFSVKDLAKHFLDIPMEIFPKVLKIFKISKTSKYPIHILKELTTEEELFNYYIKSRENSAEYIINKDRGRYYENLYVKESKKNRQMMYDVDMFTRVIHEVSKKELIPTKPKEVAINNSNKNAFCIFSDIHIGKKFDSPVFGRPYNLEVANDRLLQISNETINYVNANKIENLTIMFVGDMLECIIESGMHHAHYQSMEFETTDQLMAAYESFNSFILNILDNTAIPITFWGIGGNHDRIMLDRKEDKTRTASMIVFQFLKRNVKNDRITFEFPQNGIIKTQVGKLCFIGHHGDGDMNKRKPNELINLHGEGSRFYHIVLKGHFHTYQAQQGTNHISITLPSVCSSDDYVQNGLGLASTPGFVLMKEDNNGLPSTTLVNLY